MDQSTLTLLLAAITGSSGLAGAVAWFATLRPRLDQLEKTIAEQRKTIERLTARVEQEQAAQWSAIRKVDRTLYGITAAARAVHAIPSRVHTDVTPIVSVSIDEPDESRS